ncbi:hypothetical protein [Cellulosimicrobium cellulans]|uniref:hypothetical protein n=1 Tax=Cellulosimicrobium cellulans TaxID=1710 RepID=UPI002096F17B|nr:hypothetical protein [Cellulosimicrobium cellulans]MCO7272801.1 hypothetical protein [Cellulosimicrobium cellulans]
MPLADEVTKELKDAAKSFEVLYGREPSKSDLVFGHLSDPTDSVYESARMLISAGLNPAFAYAYVRSDGLLPTEFNADYISDADLNLFERFANEYDEPIVDLDNGQVPSFVFVSLGNELIGEMVEKAFTQMRMVLVDFLSRHMSAEQRRARMEPSRTRKVEFLVRSPSDYALFSALKTKQTLDSLRVLSTGRDAASIYSLARSIFENTVYLDSIADDASVFWEGISPKTDAENFEFGRYADGRVNFNHVVHKQTGARAPTSMRFSDLAQGKQRSSQTRDLYALFYVTASQYIHVDVLSARGYFYDADPFDELDEVLLASLLAIVLVGDLLRALQRSEGVQEGYARDVRSFLASMVDGLLEAIAYVNSDPEHVNEVFDALGELVAGWGPSRVTCVVRDK